ncbi:hypothetical protein OZX72_02950 [Bifidobacterium sp. ESL0769]|uniref:hypothetical protein n=1 Tax=Bifidobacterium sp. ESL0769 TaxID=2983229 RepID=UPI0023F6F10A|nr:hypothetical protein [Bifidobacterium sp. ESL0769]WEV67957.1 hypothetical protein OZX72_02950 [Bifidobacterium sp. ESL0769]
MSAKTQVIYSSACAPYFDVRVDSGDLQTRLLLGPDDARRFQRQLRDALAMFDRHEAARHPH